LGTRKAERQVPPGIFMGFVSKSVSEKYKRKAVQAQKEPACVGDGSIC